MVLIYVVAHSLFTITLDVRLVPYSELQITTTLIPISNKGNPHSAITNGFDVLLLVCGDCSLTSKTRGRWNLLESTPARIPLIKSNNKWTRMLFIISNYKLGIWICSQPRIYLNSQSNFYNDLNRPYKYLSRTLYKTTCTQDNLHVSSTRLWTSRAFITQIYFPLHPSLTRPHCHNNTWTKYRTSKICVPELLYSVSDYPLACLRKITKAIYEVCSDFNKFHERNQCIYNYMV